MKISKPLFLSVILLIITFGYYITRGAATIQAATENTSMQRSALESSASCGKTNYTLPPTPITASNDDTPATSPNKDGPVIADLGFFIEEIPAINELENTFTVEGRINVIWCDPRLQYTSNDQEKFKTYLEEQAHSKLQTMWWPDITFANEVAKRDTADEILLIHDNGTIEYREKFSVTLEAAYKLIKFPFDNQTLAIEIASFNWNNKHLKLDFIKELNGFSAEFEIPEWHITHTESRVEDVMEPGDRATFSQFLMEIHVTRQFGFYLWKVLLPLVALVLMCFAVFWIREEGLAERLNISFTGILTVVAYQFIATDSLPKVPYITLMDAYINFSFIIMVTTIIQSIIVSRYNTNNEHDLGLKLDQNSRWIFPLVYLLGIGLLTFVFMT